MGEALIVIALAAIQWWAAVSLGRFVCATLNIAGDGRPMRGYGQWEAVRLAATALVGMRTFWLYGVPAGAVVFLGVFTLGSS